MPKPTLPLEARDQQIAALAAAGVRHGEIARRLGVHRNSVGRRLRLPTVQEHIEAMQAQVFERVWQFESERIVEQLEAGRQARQEERARKRALRRAQRQGQGTGLPLEDSQLGPHWPIRQALDQPQAETALLEQEPASAFLNVQARLEAAHQASLEELKHWLMS